MDPHFEVPPSLRPTRAMLEMAGYIALMLVMPLFQIGLTQIFDWLGLPH